MSLSAAGAVALAYLLDRTVREPPESVHPVALFGRAAAAFDREWSNPLAVGPVVALLPPLLAAGIVWAAVFAAGRLHPVAGAVLAGGVLFATTSLQLLLDEAAGVIADAETDLRAARERLPALAGRDPDDLSADHLRSAAVESAAENLADGLVAPLLAFVLLAPASLALGAAAAAWVKAVNTLDSMLGYRSKPHGRVSARLDDAVMWLPARVSAALLSLAARSPDPVLTGRRWARAPASPNSGWPMATVAAALHVRLEKPGAYALNEVASLPTTREAERGVALVGRAGTLAYALAVLWEVTLWLP